MKRIKPKSIKLICQGHVFRITVPKKLLRLMNEEAQRRGLVFSQSFTIYLVVSQSSRRSISRKLKYPYFILQPVFIEG